MKKCSSSITWILDVDHSTVIDSGVIDSPVIGKIPPLSLSGGVKTLILVKFERIGRHHEYVGCDTVGKITNRFTE
ncbi:MAG: DUF4869 domain-containing protein [Parasporobacterium sp.]|nr:DUF4869 domain-containing protein [Parasporobacterium sp.]